MWNIVILKVWHTISKNVCIKFKKLRVGKNETMFFKLAKLLWLNFLENFLNREMTTESNRCNFHSSKMCNTRWKGKILLRFWGISNDSFNSLGGYFRCFHLATDYLVIMVHIRCLFKSYIFFFFNSWFESSNN